MARLPFWAPEARAALMAVGLEVLSGRAKEVAPSWVVGQSWLGTEQSYEDEDDSEEPDVQLQQKEISFSEG